MANISVIKEISHNPGIVRGEIWDQIHPEGRPEDNSAEADLFGYLMRELSMGGMIRQERETNADGQFMRRTTRSQRRGATSSTMTSTFEETKPYELTELGKQFVHYVMDDVVQQIKGGDLM